MAAKPRSRRQRDGFKTVFHFILVVMLPLPLLLAGAFHHPFVARVALSSSFCHHHQRHSLSLRCASSATAAAPQISRRRRVLCSVLRHRGGGGQIGSHQHPVAAACNEKRRRASSTAMMYSSVSPMLEVEEKFDLMSSPSAVVDVEGRLSTAGFVREYTVEMVDWYFDTPTYSLALSDCWLRYRQECRTLSSRGHEDDDEKEGESAAHGWQLKRGNKSFKVSTNDQPSSSRATVYEETEGIQAVALVCSILVEMASRSRTLPTQPPPLTASAATDLDDDSHYPIPVIPPIPQQHIDSAVDGGAAASPPVSPPDLAPFARIVTRRSHWIHKDRQRADASDRFAGLVVDLDATDFGHAVGEVEALVEAPADSAHDGDRNANQDAVVAAQHLIRDFLLHVIYRSDVEGDDNSQSGARVESDEPQRNRAPAQGKLECYLEKFRPELYVALVEAGILRMPSSPPVERRVRDP